MHLRTSLGCVKRSLRREFSPYLACFETIFNVHRIAYTCTCFTLGALILGMVDSIGLILCLRSGALNVRVRVCMGVTLYKGIDLRTLADLLGVHRGSIHRVIASMVAEGIVSRVRAGHDMRYHSTLAAKKLVRAELRRLRCEGANLVNELRSHPRIKLDKLDKLLGISPDIEE